MRLSLLAAICFFISAPFVLAEDEPKPLSPAEAAKKVNEEVTLQMEVKSAALKNGLGYLNSEKDFKDAKNFTLFIDKKGMAKFKDAKIEDPTAHFKGKTVRVKGKVVLHKERPEIVLNDPDTIQIVEEKEKK